MTKLHTAGHQPRKLPPPHSVLTHRTTPTSRNTHPLTLLTLSHYSLLSFFDVPSHFEIADETPARCFSRPAPPLRPSSARATSRGAPVRSYLFTGLAQAFTQTFSTYFMTSSSRSADRTEDDALSLEHAYYYWREQLTPVTNRCNTRSLCPTEDITTYRLYLLATS